MRKRLLLLEIAYEVVFKVNRHEKLSTDAKYRRDEQKLIKHLLLHFEDAIHESKTDVFF